MWDFNSTFKALAVNNFKVVALIVLDFALA